MFYQYSSETISSVREYLVLSPDICECLFFEKILEYDTLEILSIETLHLWCVIVYEVNLKKLLLELKLKRPL